MPLALARPQAPDVPHCQPGRYGPWLVRDRFVVVTVSGTGYKDPATGLTRFGRRTRDIRGTGPSDIGLVALSSVLRPDGDSPPFFDSS
jgi:hypothetical protein